MILLDTHVVLWSATDDARLGRRARSLISERDQTDPFHVSAISAWEIAMLVKKGRLDLGRPAADWFNRASAHPAWRTVPLDAAAALESVNLPGHLHGDPADRFLVATARLGGMTVVTADRAILAYGVAGHVGALDASL